MRRRRERQRERKGERQEIRIKVNDEGRKKGRSKSDRAKGDCAGGQGAADREDENVLEFYVSNYMKDGYNPANRPTEPTLA